MVTISVHALSSIKEKTIGLLGSKKAYPILFHTRFGIHTFGMKYPIDVVILDKDNTIRSIKQSLKPNGVFFWNPFFDNVVELPHGMVKELSLREGMPLTLHAI